MQAVDASAKKTSPKALRLTLLVFIPWGAIIIYGLENWREDIVRSHRAITTTGTITAIERSNHNQRDYSYEVGGISYTGNCVMCAEDKGEGSRVEVSYDPLEPSRSTLNDFATEGSRPIPLMLCVVGAFVTYFRLRRC